MTSFGNEKKKDGSRRMMLPSVMRPKKKEKTSMGPKSAFPQKHLKFELRLLFCCNTPKGTVALQRMMHTFSGNNWNIQLGEEEIEERPLWGL